jgi:predicted metal-dependent hydrolase
MSDTIQLGEIAIAVTRKDVRHVHLAVHPPDGRVTLVAPTHTRLDVLRAYAVSRLGWIRAQQAGLRGQARETPRRFIERESHYVWGRRHLLTVVECDAKPSVRIDHRRIFLSVRPGASQLRRDAVMQEWQRSLLHAAVPALLQTWEAKLQVCVNGYFLQRMKTRWGSCNPRTATIRLNTELVKKPKDLLEYVVVHELLHLIEPTHSARFTALLDQHYPSWRDARAELNALPLAT